MKRLALVLLLTALFVTIHAQNQDTSVRDPGKEDVDLLELLEQVTIEQVNSSSVAIPEQYLTYYPRIIESRNLNSLRKRILKYCPDYIMLNEEYDLKSEKVRVREKYFFLKDSTDLDFCGNVEPISQRFVFFNGKSRRDEDYDEQTVNIGNRHYKEFLINGTELFLLKDVLSYFEHDHPRESIPYNFYYLSTCTGDVSDSSPADRKRLRRYAVSFVRIRSLLDFKRKSVTVVFEYPGKMEPESIVILIGRGAFCR